MEHLRALLSHISKSSLSRARRPAEIFLPNVSFVLGTSLGFVRSRSRTRLYEAGSEDRRRATIDGAGFAKSEKADELVKDCLSACQTPTLSEKKPRRETDDAKCDK